MNNPHDETAQPVELDIVKLVGGGRGLAHHAGATWMIHGALPGELVAARPVRRRARVIEAETLEIVDAAHPARSAEPCPHRTECGGCDWPHVEPGAGTELKIDVVVEGGRLCGGLERRVRSAAVTPSPLEYRLRARLHWDPATRRLGFYGRGSRRVGRIDHCRVLVPELVRAVRTITPALADRCAEPVDVELLAGDDEVIGALRPAKAGPKEVPEEWIPSAAEAGELGGFHRLTRSSECLPGWGRSEVRMRLPIDLVVPIGSFFQGNRHLVARFFDRVAALVGPGDEPVVDLHAGVGFLAAATASVGRRDLVLVEPHRGAADAAARNLPGARVVAATAEAFLARAPRPPRSSVAIIDPPRVGLTGLLRRQLVEWSPSRVVSIGCDPATWRRDVDELIGNGYRLAHVELLDLFPSTHHVEILAVLERR